MNPSITLPHRAWAASSGLRILMVAPYVPSPIRVRPYNLLRALAAAGHSIHLICPITNPTDQAELAVLAPFCSSSAVPLRRSDTLRAYLRALPSRLPLQAAHCLTPAFVQCVRSVLRSGAYDVVHIEHLRAAEIVAQAAAGVAAAPPLVLDAVDSISLLFERTIRRNPTLKTRAITLLDLARTRRYEAAYGRRFAQIVITSPEDRWALTTLREQFGEPTATPITVVPNGVDLDYFQPQPTPRDPATIVLTGKMSYHANEAAALFLVRAIMPLVWQQHPHAQVIIAGAGPGPNLLALAQPGTITVTGAVPDLRPYLAQATIAVAPLRYGVGVQNKVLEALAMATPVVTARQSTVALHVQPGHELLVAESADEFATQINTLLANPAQRHALAQAGRAYVERHHAWATSATQLAACYRSVMAVV
jgi:glycosyltransferase involved in cell wall biosynthesis